jgi:hypothetical protein
MNIIYRFWFPAAVAVAGIGIIWATVSEDNIGIAMGWFLGILLLVTIGWVLYYQSKNK